MESSVHYLNSQEAAKILGVNVSSIKRWTDEGKLECIRTVGGHRKFLMNHLTSFIDENKKKSSQVNVFAIESKKDVELNFHILKGNFDYLRSFLLKQALKNNRQDVQNVLTGLYLGQYPLYQIYDGLLTPVLHDLGDLWMRNKLTIAEEHVATQIIRDAIVRLQGIIKLPKTYIGNALCLNLSSELHDIALKMVQNILEVRGFKTFYSGQKTLAIKINQMFDLFKLNRIYVSSTIIDNVDEMQSEFNQLISVSRNYGAKIFIGGNGFDRLTVDQNHHVERLYTFKDAYYR